MRLWSEQLIPVLPREQLLGQWRECIALLGKGWGRKHSTVDYVFKYDKQKLAEYTYIVAKEMIRRNYEPKVIKYLSEYFPLGCVRRVYKEHDEKYLQECIENLHKKNIKIESEV